MFWDVQANLMSQERNACLYMSIIPLLSTNVSFGAEEGGFRVLGCEGVVISRRFGSLLEQESIWDTNSFFFFRLSDGCGSLGCKQQTEASENIKTCAKHQWHVSMATCWVTDQSGCYQFKYLSRSVVCSKCSCNAHFECTLQISMQKVGREFYLILLLSWMSVLENSTAALFSQDNNNTDFLCLLWEPNEHFFPSQILQSQQISERIQLRKLPAGIHTLWQRCCFKIHFSQSSMVKLSFLESQCVLIGKDLTLRKFYHSTLCFENVHCQRSQSY